MTRIMILSKSVEMGTQASIQTDIDNQPISIIWIPKVSKQPLWGQAEQDFRKKSRSRHVFKRADFFPLSMYLLGSKTKRDYSSCFFVLSSGGNYYSCSILWKSGPIFSILPGFRNRIF